MCRDTNHKPAIPLLSLLIPAYESSEGVLRIINSIPLDISKDLEVIVADDSVSTKVKDCVERWNSLSTFTVGYLSHKSTGNAIDNWNYILGKATGKYVQLMHHDEWPHSENYFDELFDILKGSPLHDVVILNCLLFASGKMRKHSSVNLKRRVIDENCNLLLLRNVIGSPSNVVFRRGLEVEFDSALQWYVDVEFYVRLISNSKSTFVSQDLFVASDLDTLESITYSIKSKLDTIRRDESSYLFDTLKYIKPNRSSSIVLYLVHSLEQCFYRIFRAGTYK